MVHPVMNMFTSVECHIWTSQEGVALEETVGVGMIQLIYGCLQHFRIWQ